MSQAFEKGMMISPNSKNGNTTINKVFVALRIFAVIILLMGIKLKTNIKKEVEKEHEEIINEYEDIKL